MAVRSMAVCAVICSLRTLPSKDGGMFILTVTILDGVTMIHNGDCLEILKTLPADSVESIVTDPPYGISFMNKGWDHKVPGVDVWRECLRVLKPGGYLLAFAGTRTQHRMCCNIEDAGFEIRDMLAWVYGSGFPKSHDISKALDRAAGAEREVIGRKQAGIGTGKAYGKIVGTRMPVETNIVDITAPKTPEAKQWQGWGTALKPALEPITMARKPFKGTVANNVLTHGVGGVNVDGCRVRLEQGEDTKRVSGGHKTSYIGGEMVKNYDIRHQGNRDAGRFPSNLIHDGNTDIFPDGESRFFYCAKASKEDRDEGLGEFAIKQTVGGGGTNNTEDDVCGKYGSIKAPSKNYHPTVKPTNLMRYLVRMVTPPNGTVLDPFMGSGSTGKACKLEFFEFIGIELDADYCAIAQARIDGAEMDIPESCLTKVERDAGQLTLFGENDAIS